MDSADAASTLGAWAWIRGYFTPATFFIVVNLVIGTIALTSRATQQRRRREHYYHHDAHGHGHHLQEEPLHAPMEQPGYGHYYHPEQTLYAAPPPPAPAPLARTSSVLDRLRSFGLYRFRSGDFPPEYGAAAAVPPLHHAQDVFAPVEEEMTATAHYARSRSEPAPDAREAEDERRPAPPRVKNSGSEARKSQVARAVPRVVAAVAEDDHSVEARAEEAVGGFRRGASPLQQEYHYQEEYVPPPARARAPAAPAPLQRTSSVLDRLRSLGLYGFLAPDQPAAAASVPASDGFATPADEKRHAHYDRSRSEPAPEQGKKEKKPEAKSSRMANSSSEARKTPKPRPVEAGGECVNARAEAFIDSFRQQQQQVVHHYEEDEYVPPPAPAPPLSRTSSVLDRLRSFSLYRFRSGDLGPDLPAAAAAAETDDKEKHQEAEHYARSRSEPAREQGKKKQEARMSKSSSSGAVEEAETEECVDARADDFINKFRQQLQLQRLNSLLNYKEMLNRGGGGGKQ